MKKIRFFSLTAFFLLVLAGYLGNYAGAVYKHALQRVDEHWLCPLCNKSSDRCECTDEDYQKWRNNYPGKVFCGVLVCHAGENSKNEVSEWVDPIKEDSITFGDASGWHKPTKEIQKALIAYLKMADAEKLRYIEVGTDDWSEIDDPLIEKFFKEVYEKMEPEEE